MICETVAGVTVKAPVPQKQRQDPAGEAEARAGPSTWQRIRDVVGGVHLTVKRVLGVLGFGVTLAGLYHFYWPIVSGPPSPTPLSGDLNVGVAQLAAAPGTDESYAQALSDSTFRAVRKDVAKLGGGRVPIDLQVAGPDRVGTVEGESPADRLAEARELSRDIDAHVLLYGIVSASGDAVELRPEFAFAEPLRHPEDGQPLLSAVQVPPTPSSGGSFGVIRESAAGTDVTARASVREQAVTRARAFAAFILGLSYYAKAVEERAEGRGSAAELREASRLLGIARAGWDPSAAHVLHLFLGNVALLQGRMPAAASQYGQALDSDADYARAELGMAEVRFQQASADCGGGAVPGRLREAIRRYRSVLAAPGPQPELLRAKAQFGLGRAALCAGDWPTAERELRAVVAAYDDGATAVRAQAAGALGGLGLIVLLRGDTDPDVLRTGTQDLDRALELTPASPGKGALFSFLGAVQAQLGELRAARASYRQAMRLDPANRAAYAREADELLRGR